MKATIITAIFLIALLIGFSRWKKKSGHKNRGTKAGDILPEEKDLISQCCDPAERQGNSGGGKAAGTVTEKVQKAAGSHSKGRGKAKKAAR